MTPAATQLGVHDLSYGYARRIVGRGLSFEIKPRETLCVLGPNGSGKTTLFRTLLGLLPIRAGAITLNGVALAMWPRTELARVMAYVPQAHAAYFPFTVREIVLMGRTAHMGVFSAPGQKDREAADRALETLGIASLADQPYTRISGGERQLTLIARALAQGAQLMMLDEPTANLDFGNQIRVWRHLRNLAGNGICVIFSSHDPDHALQCAHRVLMLRDGQLLDIGTPDEIITERNLESLYGIGVRVIAVPGARNEGANRTCVARLQ